MNREVLNRLRGFPVHRTVYQRSDGDRTIVETRFTSGEVEASARRISRKAWLRVLEDRKLAEQRRAGNGIS